MFLGLSSINPQCLNGYWFYPGKPGAPTLLYIGGELPYNLSVRIPTTTNHPDIVMTDFVYNAGWNILAVDIPAQGCDQRPGEQAGLSGWADRIAKGENVIGYAVAKYSNIINKLESQGKIDKTRLVISGTYRAAYLSFHLGSEIKFAAVAGFAPMVRMVDLTEFQGLDPNTINQWDVINLTPKLSGLDIYFEYDDSDTRVNTADQVKFLNSIIPVANVSYYETNGEGHNVPEQQYIDGAKWILSQVK
ncbi:hypothetical protein [Leptospira broomii]|nr:hypothetical protein [Leptospira broomii]